MTGRIRDFKMFQAIRVSLSELPNFTLSYTCLPRGLKKERIFFNYLSSNNPQGMQTRDTCIQVAT